MKSRCFWVSDSKLYQEYHDNEWGQPVYDDETLFEFLVLETFQAGLSWITILNKRENFRKAFNNFDYEKIAKYTESKYLSLLQDAGIIRNKLKIKSAIANAQLFMQVQEEFGSFSKFIWSYVEGKPIINKFHKREEVPATTELSDKISKDFKKKRF
ncbi:DNA-3-methyladenine glycosylase [Polaribacter sp. Hel1_33_49]|nr:DNA-3-methyladenine glycosylase [Polaribacter sp. Hel1_33_49]